MDDDTKYYLLGLFFGIILGITFHSTSMSLDNATLTDICHNFTNSSLATYEIKNGKLICELPSFDSTTNIIIKKAGEEK